MEGLKELAKKMVDLMEGFEYIADAVKPEQATEFFPLVVEEMRARGMDEERIQNSMKGAYWGHTNSGKIQEEIKESPSILDSHSSLWEL